MCLTLKDWKELKELEAIAKTAKLYEKPIDKKYKAIINEIEKKLPIKDN